MNVTAGPEWEAGWDVDMEKVACKWEWERESEWAMARKD